MKRIIFSLVLAIFLSSCYYKPFIGYRLNKSGGYKSFNKWEKFAGDNANPLSLNVICPA